MTFPNIPLRAALLALITIGIVTCKAEDATASPQTPFTLAFNSNGLASFVVGGSNILADPQVRLQHLLLGPGPGLAADGKLFETTSRRFSQSDSTLEQTYRWGLIRCHYKPVENGLELEVTVHNTSSLPLAAIHLDLMQLHFPVVPKGIAWKDRWTILSDNPDEPPALLAIWDQGGIAFCNEEPVQETVFGFRPNFETGGYALVLHRDKAPIKPRESVSYFFSIRAAGKNATPAGLAKSVYAAFAKHHPLELNWPDRRPIGTVFLATPGPGDATIRQAQEVLGVWAGF